MGSWYCQPDCLVPSGESFMRQISLGREYFVEKFNSYPTVALNFDSFGHTKGLVQILNKSGFDSYIFCRPMTWYISIPDFKDYPHGPFLWEGFDGSKVKALRYEDCYNNYTTPYGQAKEQILKKAEQYNYLDIVPVLWGVGNHGGTSSAKDLEDIMELQDEKKGEWEIIHSTLEDYFNSVNPTQVETRWIFAFSKAYSSCHNVKLVHDQLENTLYRAEKVCSVADILGKYKFNKEAFKNAERALCQIEFHDVLAGTAIKTGTDSSIRVAHRAIEDLNDELFGAYYSLAKDLKAANPGDDCVVLLNPNPYRYSDYVEMEIYPPYYTNNNQYKITLCDDNGNPVEYQIIKEESHIATQHRVRLLIKADIAAYSVTKYTAHIEFEDEVKKEKIEILDDVTVKDSCKEVTISKKTGLIKSFKVGGKEYLSSEASVPMFFDDNSDPWGWRLHDLTIATFSENGWPQTTYKSSLKEMKLDNSHKGLTKDLDGLTILEEGQYLTEIQAIFHKGESHVVVNYKIYKDVPYMDVNYHVLWNEYNKGLKLKFPLNGSKKFFAQMAYGIENYDPSGSELPVNRYVGVVNGDDAFVIYNRSGIHSASKKNKNLYLTLLNGASWCAHPTAPHLPLTPKGRYDTGIEQGTHDYSLRLCVNKVNQCEKISKQFNEPVYGTICFPHGNGEVFKDTVTLSNTNVIISAFKKRNNGTYLIRLYNGDYKATSTELNILGVTKTVKFKKFEFKTLVFDGKTIVEAKDSSIY